MMCECVGDKRMELQSAECSLRKASVERGIFGRRVWKERFLKGKELSELL
jgi:hypothetical protein